MSMLHKSAGLIIIVCSFLSVVELKQIPFQPCSEKSICEVSNFAADYERNLKSGVPVLKKDHPYQIQFDFLPHFDADDVGVGAFAVLAGIDVPMPGMDTTGCKYSTCPITKETKNKYSQPMVLNRYFPTSIFTVKWKLWSKKDTSQECCVMFRAKLA